MPRGRPAKATAKHIADGTFRADRHGKRVDTGSFGGNLGAKPKAMGKVAAAAWDEVIANIPPDVLRAADRFLMEDFCKTWQELHELREWQAACDPLDESYYKLKQMIHMTQKTIAAYFAKLGLTPTDRARLKSGEGGSGEAGKSAPLSRLKCFNAGNA